MDKFEQEAADKNTLERAKRCFHNSRNKNLLDFILWMTEKGIFLIKYPVGSSHYTYPDEVSSAIIDEFLEEKE